MTEKSLNHKEKIIDLAKYFNLSIVDYLNELFYPKTAYSCNVKSIEFKINKDDDFCYNINLYDNKNVVINKNSVNLHRCYFESFLIINSEYVRLVKYYKELHIQHGYSKEIIEYAFHETYVIYFYWNNKKLY